MRDGVSTLPRMRAGWCSSTALFAFTFPFTSPWTMIVPQVTSAFTFAPSPTTSTSFVTIVPVNLPSIRTVPSNVSFPSNSEPRPRRALRSPEAVGMEASSSRFSMAIGVCAPRGGGFRTLSLRTDLREYSVELVEGRVLHLELPRDRGLGEHPTARAEPALQACREIPQGRGLRLRGPGGFALQGEQADERLGRPDGELLADHALSRLADRLLALEAEERPGVAHVELPVVHEVAHLGGEPEEPERVRDRRAVLSDALGDLLLGEAVVPNEDVVGLRLLDRVQVLAL